MSPKVYFSCPSSIFSNGLYSRFRYDMRSDVNNGYFNVVDKNIATGDTIYYAGAVFDAEGNYTIIRETYVR